MDQQPNYAWRIKYMPRADVPDFRTRYFFNGPDVKFTATDYRDVALKEHKRLTDLGILVLDQVPPNEERDPKSGEYLDGLG